MTSHTLYRKSNGNGTSKDWAIYSYNGGLRIVYGASGSKFRHTDIPASKVTPDEIDKRIRSKMDEGYAPHGAITVDGNGVAKIVKGPPPQAKVLLWELKERYDYDGYGMLLTRIAALLGKSPLPGTVVSYDREINVLSITTNGREWKFGFGQEEFGMIDPNTLRGGGEYSTDLGVLPYLILVKLDAMLPGHFGFADQDGNVHANNDLLIMPNNIYLRETGVPYALVWETALKLELVIDTRLDKVDDANEAGWF